MRTESGTSCAAEPPTGRRAQSDRRTVPRYLGTQNAWQSVSGRRRCQIVHEVAGASSFEEAWRQFERQFEVLGKRTGLLQQVSWMAPPQFELPRLVVGVEQLLHHVGTELDTAIAAAVFENLHELGSSSGWSRRPCTECAG